MACRDDTTRGGIGVVGALGIAFIVLKLCGVIDWSWWWVLAPFWVPPVALVAILTAVIALTATGAFARKWPSGRTGPGLRRPPMSADERVLVWRKRQVARRE